MRLSADGARSTEHGVRSTEYGARGTVLAAGDRVVDSGELMLQASALPSQRTLAIQVRRAASLTLAIAGSVAVVELTSSVETVVR